MAERCKAESLTELAHIEHGFFTRRGGISAGLYKSLNAGRGSGDEAPAVRENRARIQAVLSAAQLATPYQVHSADVVYVDATFDTENPPKCDALITDRPDVALGIVTADCGPVLLADEEAGVIAACHAGWRGALAGIIENTVEAMRRLGASPDRCRAAIGPLIARKSYEVGEDVYKAFTQERPDLADFFMPNGVAGKWQFDLEGTIAALLHCADVQQVEAMGQDTYDQEELFFSYRRSTHRAEADYGRQLSAILLRPFS